MAADENRTSGQSDGHGVGIIKKEKKTGALTRV